MRVCRFSNLLYIIMRDRQIQSEFRQNLITQHYHIFGNARLFCQATLQGLENSKRLLHAHHIYPLAQFSQNPYVNCVNNGILLDAISHKDVHRDRYCTVFMALQNLVYSDYDFLCKEYKKYHLPNGNLLIPTWSKYLREKNLLK
jgi:hypothetical protein